MRIHSLTLTIAATVISCTACNKEPVPQPQPAEVSEAVPPAAPQPTEAYLTSVSGLRSAPSTKDYITSEDGKKRSNWLATMQRGEVVTITETRDGWAKVKTLGDTEGYIQTDSLLSKSECEAAAVLETAKTFREPDLMNAEAAEYEPGTLLFVLKNKHQFSLVNYAGTRTNWVLTERLSSDAREVDASRLVQKLRWQERKGKNAEEITATVDLLKQHFADTRIGQLVLAEREGPAEQGAEPAGGPVDGTDGDASADDTADAADATPEN